jgi:hypothetical protein
MGQRLLAQPPLDDRIAIAAVHTREMVQVDDPEFVAAKAQLKPENLIWTGQLDARAGRQLDLHDEARLGRNRPSTC